MFKFANNAQSTLASGITNVATSLTVSAGDGAKYPAITGADTFQITVVNSAGSFEIMQVTAVAGDVLTVTRAQEGTTAIAFTAGCTVDNRITAAAIVDLRNASNLNAGTVPSARMTGAYSGITGLGTLTGLTSSGDVSITSATASTSSTTGALTVTGGVGILGTLNVGGLINSIGSASIGNTSATHTLLVNGIASGTGGGSYIGTLAGSVGVIYIGNKSAIGGGTYDATPWLYSPSVIEVPGGLNINNSAASTSSTTGALVVTGGVGIGGTLNVGGAINSIGSAAIGDASASHGLTINGIGSGTGTGAYLQILSGGTALFILGNKSIILGGAYDATPTIYSSSQIHFTNGVTVDSTSTSSSTTTGAIIVGGGIGVGGNGYFGGRLISGAAGSGGIWVDGGTNQFFGSVDATYCAIYNSAWILQASSTRAEIIPTTASTSTTTGALVVGGGLGVSGKGWFGDTVVGFGGVNQFGAVFSGRGANNCFEWGHSNTAGYGSTLGNQNGNGVPYLAFNASAGTTSNTYKTWGFKGAVIRSDLSGGFSFDTVATASADNQSLTNLATLTPSGVTVAATTASSSATTGALVVSGGIGVGGAVNGGTIRSMSQTTLSSGQGCEIVFTGGTGFLFSFDRGTSAYLPLQIGGSTITLTNPTRVTDATASSSTTTGALVVSGGIGAAGAIFATNLNITSSANIAAIRRGGAGGSGVTCALDIGFEGGSTAFGIGFRPVTDSTNPLYFANAAGTNVGTVTTTATATAYNTSSDARLKTDPQTFDGLAIIGALQPYDYAWKSTGERAHGVFAQEALEVYPEAVFYDEQNDHYGVDYSKYMPVALRAIQQLTARMTELEATIH